MKIRLVGAELFYRDRQTDSMSKPAVAFHDFAKAPKKKKGIKTYTFLVQ